MWAFYTACAIILFLGICALCAIPLVKKQTQKVLASPADFNLEYETIQLITQDRIPLHAWWLPAANSTKTVILLHGHSGSKDPDLKYTPHLHSAGFNVLMFDFRAHGRSGGRINTIGALERRDVKSAVEYALYRGSQSIGLLGFSMGGRAAVLSAPFPPEVKAVISDGGPARLSTAISRALYLRGLPIPLGLVIAWMILIGGSILSRQALFTLEPYYQAKNLSPLPVLFIHGEKDLFTQPVELEKIEKDAGPNARAWKVPEAHHRDIEQTRPVEYIEKVVTFLTSGMA